MDDGWEYDNFGADAVTDDSNKYEDHDGDGLCNYFEYEWKTKPCVRDTDGDTFLDGEEIDEVEFTFYYIYDENKPWRKITLRFYIFVSNPLVYTYIDTDNDGVPDQTDPDIDGDGLSNSVETNKGKCVGITDTGTDPNNPDSDNDGLWDGWHDDDRDGIFEAGEEPGEISYNGDATEYTAFDGTNGATADTDPNNEDSDYDYLNDGIEVNGYHKYIIGEYSDVTSDPLNVDTDGDDVPDWIENWWWIDPTDDDSDDDGLKDYFELKDTIILFYYCDALKWKGININGDSWLLSAEISVKEAPDPNWQDIYVEVDWMEEYLIDFRYVKEPGGGGYYKKVQRRVSYKMSSGAKEDVIEAFKDHNIRLHIDDGSMGGGGPIPHKNSLYYDPNEYWFWVDGSGDFNNPRRKAGDNDDFYDYKFDPNHFNPNRKGIFHYALFIHDIECEGFPDAGAASDTPGDDICMGHEGLDSDSDVAKRFMHELGRNFGLGTATTKDTVMYKISVEATCIDYIDDEWKSIYLGGVNDPTKSVD